MENRKAFIVSGICFVISIMLITAYVRVRTSEMTSEFGELVNVVVVRTPKRSGIGEFQVIRDDMVAVRQVFKKYRQPSAVEDPEDVIGKSAYVPLYEGEQVVLTKLIHQDGKPVLDRQVDKTFRAITIRVAPHTAVGYLIRPGDRVDILATPNYDMGGTTIFEVKTVVQNVLVLATGKSIQNAVPTRVDKNMLEVLEAQMEEERRQDWGGGNRTQLQTLRPADDYNTLTLQLTPEDAKKILFLSHTLGDTRMTFTLRNNADVELAKLETTLLDDVLGPDSDYGRSQRRPPPITPPKPRFEDMRGGQPTPVY